HCHETRRNRCHAPVSGKESNIAAKRLEERKKGEATAGEMFVNWSRTNALGRSRRVRLPLRRDQLCHVQWLLQDDGFLRSPPSACLPSSHTPAPFPHVSQARQHAPLYHGPPLASRDRWPR